MPLVPLTFLLLVAAGSTLAQETGVCANILTVTTTPAAVNSTITISKTLTLAAPSAPPANASLPFCGTTTQAASGGTPTSYAIRTTTVTAYAATPARDPHCAGRRARGCHDIARCVDDGGAGQLCDCATDTSGVGFCFRVQAGASCEDHEACVTNADCGGDERCMTADSTCCDQRCVKVSVGACANSGAVAEGRLMGGGGAGSSGEGGRWAFSLGDM